MAYLVKETSGLLGCLTELSREPEEHASVATLKGAPEAGEVAYVLLDRKEDSVSHDPVISLPAVSASGLTYPKFPSARGPWTLAFSGGRPRRCLAGLPLSLVARKLSPVPPQPCGLSLAGFWKR